MNPKTLITTLAITSAAAVGAKEPADYVNPIIGASTSTSVAHSEHGLGKTFPGAATPWGMTQVSPNTVTGGDNGSGYSHEHTSIEGFALTQMSGIGWYGDLGNFLVMPTTGKFNPYSGKLDNPDNGYRSRYDKNSETAKAGYYSVYLSDYDINCELTATPHGGVMRFTYPKADTSRLQVDLARRVGGTSVYQSVEWVNDSTMRGYMRCTPDGGGWGNGDGRADYTVYFYSRINLQNAKSGVWTADIPESQQRKLWEVTSDDYARYIQDSKVKYGISKLEGKHIGAFYEFPTEKGDQVVLRTAISFTSAEGAEANFNAELADSSKGFDQYLADAYNSWNNELGKIKVDGDSEDNKIIFYTAMYHTMIDPRNFTDVDGRYPGADNKIHSTSNFNRRTIFSGWDVFRSQFPLQTIINPEIVRDVVNSMVDLAEENGSEVYERWEFLNAYSGCMLGNPSISVIADAAAKGIFPNDIKKAYQFSKNTADRIGHHPQLGYSPGSISETLEYAYTDWCVSRLSNMMGDTDSEKAYAARGQAYRLIFDPEKGWFRPRNNDGSWAEWPDKGRTQEWYGCVECNPYQQGWFVPHDIEGMCEIMGGREATLADLENFFGQTPKEFWWNDYYNHANEPVHHVPFLFNRLGAPWLTQYWTTYTLRNAYRTDVYGLCGNEDVGQMSAWYILAAAGIHPICPGDPTYELTSPLFDKVEISLDPKYASADRFIITADRKSPDDIYIQEIYLNGKPYNSYSISHSKIMQGGTLHFVLGPEPKK